MSIKLVTWPDAPLPPLAATARILCEPTGLWVIYTEMDTLWSSSEPRSTAVHISQDLTVSTIDVGMLTPIGADSTGLWCTAEPYPVVERSGGSRAFDPALVQIEEDAPVEDREDLVRSSGAWSRVDNSPTEIHRLPTPPPAVATSPVTLSRYRPGGNIDFLTVDRLVSGVDVVRGKLRLTYHPTGPVQRLDPGGTSISFSYPIEVIDLDLSDARMSEVFVADYDSTPGARGFPEEWLNTSIPEQDLDVDTDEMVAAIDLSAYDDCSWTLPAEDSAEVRIHVDTVLEHLANLDTPNLMWSNGDDRWHRIRSDYRDLVVKVREEWPLTEVVAEFTYAPRGTQRFRWRVPVFDNAGRPRVPRYLTVYLMEDLDTGHYGEPDPETGVIHLRH
ncbi:hypothetical protein [Subtercola frigoramans]|uniref:Uncharacterized protein n=1 Tax=Subtercola frigoramans TaxID=120298 RepID=A0ABS2L9X9_9MICO|nr:hypothetical protein [Subtercola frigoramans]MBM7473555.1 hypothetical protein [Subtercola frigoramans]